MSIEVKVPVLPESVSDATIATWNKKPGDTIKRDENLVDLETDKVVLEVPAPADGVLKEIKQDTGATVTSQQLLAVIEEGAAAAAAPAKAQAPKAAAPAKAEPAKAAPPSPSKASSNEGDDVPKNVDDLSPAGRRVATENKIDPSQVSGTGRDSRVTKEDLVNYMRNPQAPAKPTRDPGDHFPLTRGPRPEERVAMTRMRAK